jgi:excisionase family DNA binding protein
MDATFLTVSELAAKLKVHRNTIKNLIKRGLPHLRIGSVYRFDLNVVTAWMSRSIKEQKDDRSSDR